MAHTPQRLSAATRVFATPELLEVILLKVCETRLGRTRWRARDVLLSQRVNRAFRSCILGSPEIQRRLGFKQEIIQAPGPVEDELGECGQNRLLWAFNDLVLAVTGLPRVYFSKRAKNISDEELPYSMISFERSPYPQHFEAILKDNAASFLKMYPQRPALDRIVIQVSQCEMWMVKKMGIEVFCWCAQITVKLQPLGKLFELAASLQKAAKEIERIEEAMNWWERNEDDARDYEIPTPTEVFDWKKSFTEEQMEWVAGEPEFDIH
ncbi:hypothetical protein HII31_03804 [Pseudocercospora fuligena]|uniref:Uncharacterized protein n=1 Tax=Pseudocercospora fuligena TaxID=685502 RepID=A0A8H6RNW7_9PEZI|nr:hypothetical protein HII31_03804 [Pseudocercospora fuligena]